MSPRRRPGSIAAQHWIPTFVGMTIGLPRYARDDKCDYFSDWINFSKSPSSQMVMPSSVAFCNLLPASVPARTMSVFAETEPDEHQHDETERVQMRLGIHGQEPVLLRQMIAQFFCDPRLEKAAERKKQHHTRNGQYFFQPVIS